MRLLSATTHVGRVQHQRLVFCSLGSHIRCTNPFRTSCTFHSICVSPLLFQCNPSVAPCGHPLNSSAINTITATIMHIHNNAWLITTSISKKVSISCSFPPLSPWALASAHGESRSYKVHHQGRFPKERLRQSVSHAVGVR